MSSSSSSYSSEPPPLLTQGEMVDQVQAGAGTTPVPSGSSIQLTPDVQLWFARLQAWAPGRIVTYVHSRITDPVRRSQFELGRQGKGHRQTALIAAIVLAEVEASALRSISPPSLFDGELRLRLAMSSPETARVPPAPPSSSESLPRDGYRRPRQTVPPPPPSSSATDGAFRRAAVSGCRLDAPMLPKGAGRYASGPVPEAWTLDANLAPKRSFRDAAPDESLSPNDRPTWPPTAGFDDE